MSDKVTECGHKAHRYQRVSRCLDCERALIKSVGVNKTLAEKWKAIAMEGLRAIGNITLITSPVLNDGDLRRTLYNIETAACTDMALIEHMIQSSEPALGRVTEVEGWK